MTAVAGIVTKNSNSESLAEKMLFALQHRGVSKRTRVITRCASHVEVAVGCASAEVDRKFDGSPDATVSLDGSFYRVPESNQARYFLKAFQDRETVMTKKGGYSVICFDDGRLFALRDMIGLKPLYCSRGVNSVALASERKALWAVGLRETERIVPGYLYAVSPLGLRRRLLARFARPVERSMTMNQAASQLKRFLTRSIETVTKGLDHVAVAFSGGLDSAITATLAKGLQKRVELISVGLAGSSETRTVERYAERLGLPITIETFSPDSLEDSLRRVVWLIEESNLMKVSVAVPLHWAANLAKKRNHGVMLCGQGSDELFGGYYKYARILDEKGRKALTLALYRSIVDASLVNYERDDQATSSAGVELRTPFADADLIRFALTIPSQYKVERGNDLVRKWVLRAAAQKLSLPEEIVWRRKKAIQHGTGVENEIRKLARRERVSAESYLENIYAHVAKCPTMP